MVESPPPGHTWIQIFKRVRNLPKNQVVSTLNVVAPVRENVPSSTAREARSLVVHLQALIQAARDALSRSREIIVRLDSTRPPKPPDFSR